MSLSTPSEVIALVAAFAVVIGVSIPAGRWFERAYQAGKKNLLTFVRTGPGRAPS